MTATPGVDLKALELAWNVLKMQAEQAQAVRDTFLYDTLSNAVQAVAMAGRYLKNPHRGVKK